MKRALAVAFGLTSYALFLGVFLYLIAFLGDFWVARTIDRGLESPTGIALLVNLGLILLFGLQHSVMARPGFKRAWTRVVAPAVERSVYVLLSSLALILLMWQWRPMGGALWDLSGTPAEFFAWALFAFGWGLLLLSTWLINHFDLFGLRQVAHFARGSEPRELAFSERFLYRFMRHPIYVGWLIAIWSTPTMTLGHLVFAGGMTVYIVVAIPYEERDLIAIHGEQYLDYRERVPALVGRVQGRPRSVQA